MGRLPPFHTAAGMAALKHVPLVETGQSGLCLAAPRTANLELLGRSLDELAELCADEQGAEAMRLLQHLVPEYISTN